MCVSQDHNAVFRYLYFYERFIIFLWSLDLHFKPGTVPCAGRGGSESINWLRIQILRWILPPLPSDLIGSTEHHLGNRGGWFSDFHEISKFLSSPSPHLCPKFSWGGLSVYLSLSFPYFLVKQLERASIRWLEALGFDSSWRVGSNFWSWETGSSQSFRTSIFELEDSFFLDLCA